jgi:serine/threonine protein phosphatase PrpC
MPAVSKKQQKLFAIVKAYKDGKNDKVDQKVKDIANNISDDDATDMASTSTKGLLDKVSKEEIVRALIHNEIMSEGKADKYDKIVDKFAKTLRLKNGYKIYDNKLVMKTNLSQSTLDQ